MPITIHPKPGQILYCDFSQGFKAPEIIKNKRPVIVLTGQIKGRGPLVTVVPLSTTTPQLIQSYHYKLPKHSMPMLGIFQENDSWVKGDLLYTVGFHRLDLIQIGKRNPDGKRQYYRNRLGREQMKLIFQCILHGLNLGHLGTYL